MIVAADEQCHEPDAEDRNWQESFYFNWADETQLALARVGFTPGPGTMDATLFTVRNGNPEYVLAAVGHDIDGAERDPAVGIGAGGLTFTMNEALGEWHIGLDDGKNHVDLTWTAVHEPHCYHDGLLTLGATEEQAALMPMHFEQIGTVRGVVRLGGKERVVDTYGHRDKSWGPRDWAAITGWEWLSAQFGPDLGFNATLWYPPDSDPVPAGFIVRDGVRKTLLFTHVDYDWLPLQEHVARRAIITLVDEDEQQYVVKATALGQLPLYKKGLFIQETHARFEMIAGREMRTGHGVLEHAWHSGGRGALARLHQFAPVIATAVRQKVGV